MILTPLYYNQKSIEQYLAGNAELLSQVHFSEKKPFNDHFS